MTRRLLVAGALVVAGCGSSGAAARFAVDAPWARPTPARATNGVVYLTVSSDVDDALVAAEVPPDVAASAEIHTSMLADGSGSHHGGGSEASGEPEASAGAVVAGETDGIPVAAGAVVQFEPGGNHVMLIDVVDPLAVGDTFPLTLRFASGRALIADVRVADNPPG